MTYWRRSCIFLCQRRLVTLDGSRLVNFRVYLLFIFFTRSACLCKKTYPRQVSLCNYFFDEKTTDDKTDLFQLLNNYTNWLSKHCCHRCQTSANSFESHHYPNLTVINEVFSISFCFFLFLVISLWQPMPTASGRLNITLTTGLQLQQQHTCNCS